jgi:hypothetical protein
MKKKVSNFFQILFSPSGENSTIIFSFFGIYALIKYNLFLYPKCMTQLTWECMTQLTLKKVKMYLTWLTQ